MSKEIILNGVPAAPGVAFAPAFILDEQEFIVSSREILPEEIPAETARFHEAVDQTHQELLGLREQVQSQLGKQSANIFDAHIMLLEDPAFKDEVVKAIKSTVISAESAFSVVLKKYVTAFSKIEDNYLKERASDVSDIGRRVLKHLIGETRLHDLEMLVDDVIVLSHDISPSDAVGMHNKKVRALVTNIGGQTSHTAIIAKSLGVPAVVGLKDATLQISNQDEVIVDGVNGLVIVNPSQKTQEKYLKQIKTINAAKNRFDDVKDLPAETLDGKKVSILANIELASEIPTIRDRGAEGVGLYRTEFLYMNRNDLPSEEEQFSVYKNFVEEASPHPVTIRTLDLGGDKFLSSIQIPKEMIPFLGLRAIRFCLECPTIFKVQLRAILRASAFGKIKLMFPMIAGLSDFREAKDVLQEVKKELDDEGVAYDKELMVGMMVEVPSAVTMADLLAVEADFFSIGTNDLIQYMLAVERVNQNAAHLYEPGHPAIIRAIKRTIDAAHDEGIKVSLCGEMSSDPAYALVLLGLGLDEFSMSVGNLLQIKSLIRSVRFSEMQSMADEVLELETAKEIKDYLIERLHALAPDII